MGSGYGAAATAEREMEGSAAAGRRMGDGCVGVRVRVVEEE
jgi:hypothetical protein